jgi:predicted nucleotidyltransferase
MNDEIVATAAAIRAQRYADCSALFVAGSLIRGEGTAHSDLDLVVIFPALNRAYRESFKFGRYPVEAFVHDPETLEYFFVEIDRPSGIPALPQMVAEGIEVPEPTEFSVTLKRRARAVLASGPPALDSEAEARLRYLVTDTLNDLRDARSYEELLGTGSQLFEMLANYYFRSRGLWSVRGKAIPRGLMRADPVLGAAYRRAFEDLFKTGEPNQVIALAEDLLRDRGGPLFDGYKADAPAEWRSPHRGTIV